MQKTRKKKTILNKSKKRRIEELAEQAYKITHIADLTELPADRIEKEMKKMGILDNYFKKMYSEAEETISDAVDDMQDALKDGESLSDALHDSLKDEMDALKDSIESLDDLSIADLKVALKTLGLSVGGNKGALLDRLTTALEGME